MIAILSPAKTINMEKPIKTNLYTTPLFLKEADILMKELKNYTPPEMESLMKINSELALQNFFRHLDWSSDHDPINGRQAILAYDGAVFQGISPYDFDDSQLLFANEHVRILSGLYGVLRPLDLIKPYRLEMGTKLKNAESGNLYGFWKDRLTEYIKREIFMQDDNILIDLASKEYSTAIDLNKINSRVITPVFKDYKRGAYRNVTIYAKRARGLMIRFIIKNNISSPVYLKEFEEEDYRYNDYMSTETEWVFIR